MASKYPPAQVRKARWGVCLTPGILIGFFSGEEKNSIWDLPVTLRGGCVHSWIIQREFRTLECPQWLAWLSAEPGWRVWPVGSFHPKASCSSAAAQHHHSKHTGKGIGPGEFREKGKTKVERARHRSFLAWGQATGCWASREESHQPQSHWGQSRQCGLNVYPAFLPVRTKCRSGKQSVMKRQRLQKRKVRWSRDKAGKASGPLDCYWQLYLQWYTRGYVYIWACTKGMNGKREAFLNQWGISLKEAMLCRKKSRL